MPPNIQRASGRGLNLRTQPTCWHLIRKNFDLNGDCISCGLKSEGMDLHEEWTTNMGKTVLMGLFPLCKLCHRKITGMGMLKREEWEKWHLFTNYGVVPDHIASHYWRILELNDDSGILNEEVMRITGDEFDLSKIYGNGRYIPYHIGMGERSGLIDLGENHQLEIKRFTSDPMEAIIQSESYQRTLENPPSDPSRKVIIEHILSDFLPKEAIDSYYGQRVYGHNWYYRYYGHNISSDFGLVAKEGEMQVWSQNPDLFVVIDGVKFAIPFFGPRGYSKEQVLHFGTVYVEKYGDILPSTMLGQSVFPRYSGHLFSHLGRSSEIDAAKGILLYSAYNIAGGYGEVRERIGLSRAHGQKGPKGHPLRIVNASRRCLCGKNFRKISQKTHKEECQIYRELWENLESREHVDNSDISKELQSCRMDEDDWLAHMKESQFLGFQNPA